MLRQIAMSPGATGALDLLARRTPPEHLYRAAAALAPSVLRGKAGRLERDVRELFPGASAAQVRDLVRRQLVHRAWSAVDKVVLPRIGRTQLLARVDAASVEASCEALDEALSGERGAILYSLHYGRPMAALQIFPHLGYASVAIRGCANLTAFARFEAAGPTPDGLDVVDARGVTSLVRAVRALQRGQVLFVLVDGRISGRPALVPFLGRQAAFATSFVRLAQQTGAALVAGAVSSTDAFGFRIDLTPVPTPASDEAPEVSATSLFEPLERAVLRDVGQWYGINRVFRGSATGDR